MTTAILFLIIAIIAFVALVIVAYDKHVDQQADANRKVK